MKNVTISLPDELAHRAKVFAAEQNTSVSKYVGELLAERLEAERGYGKALKAWRARKPVVLQDASGSYPKRDSLHER
ncbi:MAG: CopG family transcriptional regulator [Verrucomicrobia bacterium]|nr:CopG family transcriptional regulator [Kiritimatiellia bacterium]MCP5487320.1 CopG family transcriptional regulator [Verrucomicrobiota bacterium]